MTLQTLGIKCPSDVKKLKTMSDLSAAQQALLDDIASRELTVAEGRPIQKELSALRFSGKISHTLLCFSTI